MKSYDSGIKCNLSDGQNFQAGMEIKNGQILFVARANKNNEQT